MKIYIIIDKGIITKAHRTLREANIDVAYNGGYVIPCELVK